MIILYVHVFWLLLAWRYFVYCDTSSYIDIYKHPKSTWANDTIVFALNLPFNICAKCHNKISGSGYNTAQFYAAAAAIAVEDINNNPNILKDHKLRYVWNQNETDTRCNEFEAIRIQLKQMDIGVHGFIGFTCSCLTVAKNAAAMNLPLFSMSCAEMELSDKVQYPTFARTTAINNNVVYMIVSMFEKFNWNTFAVVYEETHLWMPIYDGLSSLIRKGGSNGKFRMTLEVTYEKSETYQGGYETLDHKFGPFLDRLPTRARVVLLLIDKGFLSQFMLMASKRGLTNGEYVFIVVHPFANTEAILHHDHPMKDYAFFLTYKGHNNILYNDSQALGKLREAYQSLMVLMPEFPPLVKNDSYVDFQNRVLQGMAKPPFYSKSFTARQKPHSPPQTGRLYDAVMLYAVGLNRTITKNQSITNGTAIVENIKGLKVTSVVGQRFIVDGNADVQKYFDVLQFQFNVTKHPMPFTECPRCWSPKKIFKLIPVYNSSRPDLRFELKESENKPYWRKGLPVDMPVCGFSNENCRGISPVILAFVASLTILATIMIIVLIILYRNYHIKKELYNQMWKIEPSDLYFHDWKGASASSLGSLISQTLTINFEASDNQRFATVAIYKGSYVAIKKVNRKSVELTKPVLIELKQMRDVRHSNLNQFIGACVEPNNIMVIYQYASKGSLQDMLENSEIKLDTLFILSLVYDIVKGMMYLHSTDIKSHGNLKSSNCVVDSRWVLKVTDYGLKTFKDCSNTSSDSNCNNLLWKSPELLRLNDSTAFNGSQKGDVYSFAIILQECQTRDGAWGNACQDPETIIERVRKCSNPPYRPIVPQLLDGAEGLRDVMKKCWSENPDDRPSFSEVRKDIEAMMKANGLKTNIFDNMIYMMEKYSDNLEDIVEERTGALIDEKHKVEALLERMLPQSVARQLMKGKEVEAESFEEVTIYFSDIVGFTNICSSITPMEVVQLLNCLYTMFDRSAKDYDVYKVETIGDAYMVVSGLPVRNGKQHVKEICLFALDILQNVQSFKTKSTSDQQLKIRIGVHCGPVVAGVVGTTMPRYCLFGDTVNVAARMESTGEALRIHISKYVRDMLACFQGFSTESRGFTVVKGKGELETYWLTNIDPAFSNRGSNLKRNQSSLYMCPNNSSMYNFIRESPRSKHNYQKSHAMTDCLPRSPLIPRFEAASGEISRKNKKEHVNGFGPFLPSGLCKKKEKDNCDSKGGIYELLDILHDDDTKQLLKVSFPNSEKEATETDHLAPEMKS